MTEDDFNIWEEQLIIYLVQNEEYELFLDDGRYNTWRAAEDFPHRLAAHVAPDQANNLAKRRKQLRTFLSHVAKSCHKADFQSIMRHSTSFKWITDKLRENYDIQKKGVHFLNIIDIQWDPTQDVTYAAFYNTYRTHILNNLRRQGEVVLWQGDGRLAQDEKVTPMLEDIIVYNVLGLIDSRLPALVREKFGAQMRQNKSLRDLKGEIFIAIPAMIKSGDKEDATANMGVKVDDLHLAAFNARDNSNGRDNQFRRGRGSFNSRGSRGFGNRGSFGNARYPSQDSQVSTNKGFCRLCHLARLPQSVVSSHRLGDPRCTQLSARDKIDLQTPYNNAMNTETQQESNADLLNSDLLAIEYGYGEIDNISVDS